MHIVQRVVAQVVRRLPRSVPREDLVAAGTFGLYEALQKGDPGAPAMFAAYASIRVRGAIFDELRRLDWFPRRRRAENENETPTHELRSPSRSVVRFDDLEGGEPASTDDASPVDHVEMQDAYQALHVALRALPERERTIVSMRYFDGMSGKDVALALGLSEARVSQLHARAIDRLQRELPIAA